jgi:hypothetical protein
MIIADINDMPVDPQEQFRHCEQAASATKDDADRAERNARDLVKFRARVLKLARADQRLSSGQGLLLHAMADRAYRGTGPTWGHMTAAYATYAKDVGRSRRSVIRDKEALRRSGYLVLVKAGGGRRANVFRLGLPRPTNASPEASLTPSRGDTRVTSEVTKASPSRGDKNVTQSCLEDPVKENPPPQGPRTPEPASRCQGGGKVDDGFAKLWTAWPNKDGELPASQAWAEAVKKGFTIDGIWEGFERFLARCKANPILRKSGLSRWIREERWRDGDSAGQPPQAPEPAPELEDDGPEIATEDWLPSEQTAQQGKQTLGRYPYKTVEEFADDLRKEYAGTKRRQGYIDRFLIETIRGYRRACDAVPGGFA